MESIRELEYLREIKHKFGSHYIRKYFGFTFKEIAARVGLSKKGLSDILSGRYGFGERKERFIQVFKEMQIEEKTRNYELTPEQRGLRAAWEYCRKCLTKSIFLFIMINTMMRVNFLNPTYSNYPEYLVIYRRISKLSGVFFQAVVVLFTTAAFLFFNIKTSLTHI